MNHPAALPIVLLAACGDATRLPDASANPDPGSTDAGEALDWPDLPDLDDAILAEMDRSHIPGLSACLIQGEEISWCQGYGWADVDAERPVEPSTGFLLASVSKTVTTVAVAQAWEAGALDLDEDINHLLAFEVRHPESPSAAISARMLLTHVSGIADNWDVMDESYTDGADSPIPLEGFLSSYLEPGGSRYDADQNFIGSGPKDLYEYSNIGAAVAGEVVSEATGTPFDQWCEEKIFGPLEMDGAAWFLADLDPETLAVPMERRAGGYVEIGHYGFPDYPSGQLRAGAVDMARFLRATMRGGEAKGQRILQADTAAELRTVQFPNLDETQGLGFYSWQLDGEEVWGHNGGESGAETEITWWPDQEIGVIVLMNAEGKANTLERIELAIHDAAGLL